MIAILCTKEKVIKTRPCKDEVTFTKMMKDETLKWGYLLHKKSGTFITAWFQPD